MVAYNKDDAHKRNQTALRERANQWVLEQLTEKYDYAVVVQHDNLKKIWDTELREGTDAQMQRLKFYNEPHLRYEVQVKKAEKLAEDQKANTQSASEQAARQRAVKMAHDVGLKVWDPQDLDALDNLPRTAAPSAPARPGQAQITRGAVEAFLATAEGNRMRTDLGLVPNDVFSAMRDQCDKLEREVKLKTEKIFTLTTAAQQLRACGNSMISYMDGAGMAGVQPQWREFFDLRRGLDSPLRPDVGGSSAGGSSCGDRGPRRASQQLQFSGERAQRPSTSSQNETSGSQDADLLDDEE